MQKLRAGSTSVQYKCALRGETWGQGLLRTKAGMPRTSAESCAITALQRPCRGPAETELHCLQRAVKDSGQLGRQQQVTPCGKGSA